MWSCGYLASRRTAPVGRLLASLVLLLTVSNAFAYDGVTFGLQVATPASGSVPLTANVVVPVATLTDGAGAPVGLAVRGARRVQYRCESAVLDQAPHLLPLREGLAASL